jgi:hypothetical protein
MKIAGDICLYTNHNLTIEQLDIELIDDTKKKTLLIA